jgi:hypothetical protein
VRDVVVGQPVHDLAAAAGGGHQPGSPQDSQMLRDQRLADPDRVDELVDAARAVGQPDDHGEPHRRGQGP